MKYSTANDYDPEGDKPADAIPLAQYLTYMGVWVGPFGTVVPFPKERESPRVVGSGAVAPHYRDITGEFLPDTLTDFPFPPRGPSFWPCIASSSHELPIDSRRTCGNVWLE